MTTAWGMVMGFLLKSLRDGGPSHRVEPSEIGFSLVRKRLADRIAFNQLAREVMDQAGDDYVALPRSDGPASYDRVFIIPLQN